MYLHLKLYPKSFYIQARLDDNTINQQTKLLTNIEITQLVNCFVVKDVLLLCLVLVCVLWSASSIPEQRHVVKMEVYFFSFVILSHT